jgi:hypothetical protein
VVFVDGGPVYLDGGRGLNVPATFGFGAVLCDHSGVRIPLDPTGRTAIPLQEAAHYHLMRPQMPQTPHPPQVVAHPAAHHQHHHQQHQHQQQQQQQHQHQQQQMAHFVQQRPVQQRPVRGGPGGVVVGGGAGHLPRRVGAQRAVGVTVPAQRGYVPRPRYGHTLCEWRERLVLFGGLVGDSNDPEVYVLTESGRTWSRLPLAASGPPAAPLAPSQAPLVKFHTAAVVGDSMYVFGGTVFTTLYVLDLLTGSWSRYDGTTVAPSPRCKHACTVMGTVMYIFGGEDMSVPPAAFKVAPSYLWAIDTADLSRGWLPLGQLGAPLPSPRVGCTLTAVPPTAACPDARLVLLGGKSPDAGYVQMVMVFSFATGRWDQVPQAATLPKAFHTAVYLRALAGIVVFGGGDAVTCDGTFRVLNVDRMTWEQPEQLRFGASAPCARYSHASAPMGECRIVTVGGKKTAWSLLSPTLLNDVIVADFMSLCSPDLIHEPLISAPQAPAAAATTTTTTTSPPAGSSLGRGKTLPLTTVCFFPFDRRFVEERLHGLAAGGRLSAELVASALSAAPGLEAVKEIMMADPVVGLELASLVLPSHPQELLHTVLFDGLADDGWITGPDATPRAWMLISNAFLDHETRKPMLEVALRDTVLALGPRVPACARGAYAGCLLNFTVFLRSARGAEDIHFLCELLGCVHAMLQPQGPPPAVVPEAFQLLATAGNVVLPGVDAEVLAAAYSLNLLELCQGIAQDPATPQKAKEIAAEVVEALQLQQAPAEA